MNLRDLEYLVALDEHRHFGRASAACFVSQPTLSTQIRKLEAELEVQLVERGGRRVQFTHVGTEVVRRARHVLADVEEIRGIAAQSVDPASGSVRLGIFPTLGPYLLPHIMPALQEVFPELRLLLVEEKTETLVEQLESGELDAIIIAQPVQVEGADVVPLFREDFVLVGPANDEEMAGGPLEAGDLAGSELLLLTEGHCLRDQALDFCRASRATERGHYRATSMETLRHMVASGAGKTLIPRLAMAPPVSPNPALALREFQAPAPHRDIALVWRSGSVYRDLLPKVASIIREAPGELVKPLA